jgi:large subunit ribosomal protein L7/L12
MGLIRKMMSVSTGGGVDFRSDKERTAAYTKAAMKEAKKQTQLMRQQAAQQAQANQRLTQPASVGLGIPRGTAAEHGECEVILEAAGDRKIQVIKELRALTSLGLKETKDLVDDAPVVVLEKVTKEFAEKAKVALEGAGATVIVIAEPVLPVEPVTVHPSAMDELGKLAELRASGAVSQEEFELAKAKILDNL